MSRDPVIVVGGGPAGLAAAIEASRNGAEVLLVDREKHLGGILNQCIHPGFGLQFFGRDLTGPEFAELLIEELRGLDIRVKTDTTVIEVSPQREVTLLGPAHGSEVVKAGAVVLAMGCRERPRGALHIPGTRPSGIFTAGLAQKFVNMDGYLPGKEVVILGSGDIGLIMARRLTLEGAKVPAVLEIKPFPGGLTRNVVQCLQDYDIPLKLSHTVTFIEGEDRVEAVRVSEVDENLQPIPESAFRIPCDTLLLSVGLVPENELSEGTGLRLNTTNGPFVDENLMASLDGFFACGNVLHVHDLADWASEEAQRAGVAAARYASGEIFPRCEIKLRPGAGVSYVVPNYLSGHRDVRVFFRVLRPMSKATIRAGAFSKKLRFIFPNEMASFVLPRDAIAGEDEIILSLEEGGKTEKR
jgi:NADPH-dependent 2,4-dienoyl-CoA reductase/sulfur reductase-like enzyme